MILDLGRFTALERPLWEEFENMLARFERDSGTTMSIEEIARFHYLYALGMTWGIGSVVTIFYNGVTLGAVAADYMQAGYVQFLLGWLLPHGVIEIPAILVAGQAGFVLAGALIGWGDQRTRRERLRLVSTDVLTLAGTAAVMLAWAGIVEAFLSQYHQPVLPYNLKIAFGLIEFVLLVFFFARAGQRE